MTIEAFGCRRGKTGLLRPSLGELPALLADPEVALWLDITGSAAAEERFLTEELGLHALLVEDVMQESQPKLEHHDDLLYLIVHGIDPAHRSPADLRTVEVDLLLGDQLLLTHHERPIGSVDELRRRVEQDADLLHRGPWFLAHAVLDHLTDDYVPFMDDLDEAIDRLELQILRGQDGPVLERIFELKHTLQRIRRIGLHQKDILLRLSRGGHSRIPAEALPFFSDIYDHFLRVSDLGDGYRDLVSAALDAYLGVQSHRMNEIVKVLTLISTIMLPLSFIVGLYGMNFDHMPELTWEYGYGFAWGLMLATALGFLVFFKRRRWL